MEIKRDRYLDVLVRHMHNRLVKVVTGVRRCGKSYLLNTLFKKHLLNTGVAPDHIIEMAFDYFSNARFRDPAVFFKWASAQIADGDMHYLLLDEIQYLGQFESVLNDFASRPNCDVYVTGSNARLLSRDIATEFGGRSFEVRMHPLSFSEFMSVFPGDELNGWNEYMMFGGIPMVVLEELEEDKMKVLNGLFEETYLRDVVKRYKIRNTAELGSLVTFLASGIGSLTNPSKLHNAFRSVAGSKITIPTLTRYLENLKDAFLVEEARRYDVKGKAYLSTPAKYYFTDIGLRNARLGFRQIEPTHTMENIIYNELRLRGYSVDVGNVPTVERNKDGKQVRKQLEVDFVCRRNARTVYIQSAFSLADPEKAAQEIRPFLKIDDVNRKVIIAFGVPRPYYTPEGVYVISLFDFLRNDSALG